MPKNLEKRGEARSPWSHLCPLILIHHQKNTTTVKSPTEEHYPAPKTRMEDRILGSKSRRVSQIQNHLHKHVIWAGDDKQKQHQHLKHHYTNIHGIDPTSFRSSRRRGFWGMKQSSISPDLLGVLEEERESAPQAKGERLGERERARGERGCCRTHARQGLLLRVRVDCFASLGCIAGPSRVPTRRWISSTGSASARSRAAARPDKFMPRPR